MIHYMTSNGLGNAWVGNEIRVVKKASLPVVLHALWRADSTFFSSSDMVQAERETRVLYPLHAWNTFVSVLQAPFVFRGRFLSAAWNALTGPRESLTVRVKTIWHFLVACHWARTLRGEQISLIHSQWIHSGGTVAMYGAWLLGASFSFTGHAADLFRERCALRDKIARARFIICISEFHRQFFLSEGARPEQLAIAYCGIDSSHFSPRSAPRAAGSRPRILSSGRLVEKKGFLDLVDACKELRDRGLDFECVIAGSGPGESGLRERIRLHGLEDRVVVTGQPLLQEKLPEVMHDADVYCLACIRASDGDIDGLPQMLMEAMACGLPVVSTRLVGIPDLVVHEQTGLLAEPNDARGLADCLQRLLQDAELSRSLARAGRDHVLQSFDLTTCLDPLIQRFRAALHESP